VMIANKVMRKIFISILLFVGLVIDPA
jgi:hypothetical protein